MSNCQNEQPMPAENIHGALKWADDRATGPGIGQTLSSFFGDELVQTSTGPVAVLSGESAIVVLEGIRALEQQRDRLQAYNTDLTLRNRELDALLRLQAGNAVRSAL